MKTCENYGTEHNGTYGSGRFCSTECARGFSTKAKRKEINEKVSEKLTGRIGIEPVNKLPRVLHMCKCCNTKFEVRNTSKQKYCSFICKQRHLGMMGGRISVQGKRSKNEIAFANLCKAHFENVKTNESIFNGWDADVILVNEKIAILWNGKWHYEKITETHSLKQVQNRDRIKIKEIKECGYTPYIIKDMGKYNLEFVKEEFNKFLNSGELSSNQVS
jgi:hypothetical protein